MLSREIPAHQRSELIPKDGPLAQKFVMTGRRAARRLPRTDPLHRRQRRRRLPGERTD